MMNSKKIVVVLPAFNAEKTLEKTYREIPHDLVDAVILVDDKSCDRTVQKAQQLGIQHLVLHHKNQGYGANQKTCYREALKLGADIVVMLHPDYQYPPRLMPSMTHLIAYNIYPVVLGSRILGRGALKGGMPLYKYFFNRMLTFIQNILMGAKLSEYHTGYRAYARHVLEEINFEANADDFVFDNQVLAQIHMAGYEIAEITCPTKYDRDSSSIGFVNSVKYGLGVLKTSFQFLLEKTGIFHFKIFH
ncbi:MAG: glycosyltransferase family 2 protein [Bacteroidales bacterium]|jgi:glycosyltransferase involved in cell wall biosynthesis|nr:glycosyltransferase family 2 protein [Bacteroidales bacterium]